MMSTDRVLSLLILSLGFTLACASPGDGPSPQGCSGDEQCSATARCIANACVENVAPIADFSVSGDLYVASEVTLDASASHDLDTGDAVNSYKWEVSAGTTSAPECQAPTIASTEKIVHVIFACAGNWDVKLVAYDKKQAPSAAVAKTVTVAARTGAAILTAGASQSVGHVCSGSPLKCTTATVIDTASTPTSVQLSAALNTQTPLTVRWSVDQRPAGRETASVTFDDPTSLTPKVVIATNGSAISGDWVFRVDALNGTTVVASTTTQVSVENRRPVITHGAVGEFGHKYDSATQSYSASGTIPLQIMDPDGDTVTSEASCNQVNAGSSTFQAVLDGSNLMLSIFAGTNSRWLRGPSDLARTITVYATDANGAVGNETLPVAVGNNKPQLNPPSSWSFNSQQHRFNTGTKSYRASLGLAIAYDADGDPMMVTSITGPSDCTKAYITPYSPSYLLAVDCEKSFSSVNDLQGFVGIRTVTATVSDPWEDTTASLRFQILNSAPQATTDLTSGATVSCYGTYFESKTFVLTLAPKLIDPDGDPLQVVPSASISTVATSGTNPTLQFTLPRTEYTGGKLPSTPIPFSVSDGVSTPTFTFAIQPVCG